jgi:hypothetical protein
VSVKKYVNETDRKITPARNRNRRQEARGKVAETEQFTEVKLSREEAAVRIYIIAQ